MKIDHAYLQSAYALDSIARKASLYEYLTLIDPGNRDELRRCLDICRGNSPDDMHVRMIREPEDVTAARRRLGQALILIGNNLQREPHPE